MRFPAGAVPLVLLAGCTAEPLDATAFSRDLIVFQAERLEELKAEVGYVEHEVNDGLSDGESSEVWNGTVDLLDGAWRATGTGTHTRTDDTFRAVAWDAGVTFTDAAIDGSTVSGEVAWTVDENLFEGAFLTHELAGTLTVDGDDLPVALEAQRSWTTTNWVRGTVGAETVDWENPNPDVP